MSKRMIAAGLATLAVLALAACKKDQPAANNTAADVSAAPTNTSAMSAAPASSSEAPPSAAADSSAAPPSRGDPTRQ
jgi:hypothetical protein